MTILIILCIMMRYFGNTLKILKRGIRCFSFYNPC
jgi:hypothetical protein